MIRENKLYDELKVKDGASIKRVCTGNDLYIFSNASGARKIRIDDGRMPELPVQRHQHFNRPIEACKDLEPICTAVVAPEDNHSLAGTVLAVQHGIIRPILIGSVQAINAVVGSMGADTNIEKSATGATNRAWQSVSVVRPYAAEAAE